MHALSGVLLIQYPGVTTVTAVGMNFHQAESSACASIPAPPADDGCVDVGFGNYSLGEDRADRPGLPSLPVRRLPGAGGHVPFRGRGIYLERFGARSYDSIPLVCFIAQLITVG
ncbi:MAG: hypothetical protein JWR34_4798 [Mycobacterium sp.]|nr:hypothetical protein [Mycobacterium sp.]